MAPLYLEGVPARRAAFRDFHLSHADWTSNSSGTTHQWTDVLDWIEDQNARSGKNNFSDTGIEMEDAWLQIHIIKEPYEHNNQLIYLNV